MIFRAPNHKIVYNMLSGQANEEIAQLGHKTKGRSIKVLML